MALEIPIVGQDFGRRETGGSRAQGMWNAVEKHWREANALAPKRTAEMQVEIAGRELDGNAARRRGLRTDRNHVMIAVRNERANLLDHPEDESVGARPEADDHRFRVLSEQREYEAPDHRFVNC